MKEKFLITLFVLSSIFVFAQKNIGIVGDWYTEDKEAVVTISTDGKTFFGTTFFENCFSKNIFQTLLFEKHMEQYFLI